MNKRCKDAENGGCYCDGTCLPQDYQNPEYNSTKELPTIKTVTKKIDSGELRSLIYTPEASMIPTTVYFKKEYYDFATKLKKQFANEPDSELLVTKNSEGKSCLSFFAWVEERNLQNRTKRELGEGLYRITVEHLGN